MRESFHLLKELFLEVFVGWFEQDLYDYRSGMQLRVAREINDSDAAAPKLAESSGTDPIIVDLSVSAPFIFIRTLKLNRTL
jgi:hypothetical protein